MKNIRKNAFFAVLAACLMFAVWLVAAACTGDAHTQHVDADNDGLCDECGDPMPGTGDEHTVHVDADNDGKCDECGDPMPNTEPDDPTKVVYTVSLCRNDGRLLTGEINLVARVEHANGDLAMTLIFRSENRKTMELDADTYTVKVVSVSKPKNFTVNDQAYTMSASAPSANIFLTPTAPASEPAEYTQGSIMYDYTFTSVKGDDATVTLSDLYADHKIVFLSFFYVGCIWCEREMGPMLEAYQNYKDDMVIVFLDIYAANRESDSSILNWAEEMHIGDFFIGRAGDLETEKFKYNGQAVTGVPLSVFVDSEGVIVELHPGAMTDASGECTVDAAMTVFRRVFASFGESGAPMSAGRALAALPPCKRED